MGATTSVLVIVNPIAGGGRGARLGSTVAGQQLGVPFQVYETVEAGDASRRAAAWVGTGENGAIIAVGGDGTVHEVVNGMWEGGRMVPLAVVPAGTGNDIARNAGMPADPSLLPAALARGATRRHDLGQLDFREPGGGVRQVVFLNSASVGISPAANQYAQRLSRIIPGRFRYAAGGVLALFLTHRRALVARSTAAEYRGTPLNLTVANGAAFGGGMKISPGSSPYDGVLDLVLIERMGMLRALAALSRLYAGSHVRMPEVSVEPLRGQLTITSEGSALLVESDGQEFRAAGEVRMGLAKEGVEVLGSVGGPADGRPAHSAT